MANLRDLKNRIDSIRNTRQITNAMKMVAASRLRKSQESVVKARPYANYVDLMLRSIKHKYPHHLHPFLSGYPSDSENKQLVVVVSADKGLCGSFNSSVTRSAIRYLQENPNCDLVCIGRKAAESLRSHHHANSIIQVWVNLPSDLSIYSYRYIVDEIITYYQTGKYEKVVVIYNEFKSAIQQNLIVRQLLPVTPAEEGMITDTNYIYEPDEDSIIEELCRKYLDIDFWRIILESTAAEQGARMTAMDNATTNAGALIETLSLEYNRERQAKITTEIIEISSGAEASDQ